MRLHHKKVLVTGASRGIGKAIALRLAQEGAEVAVHYLNNQTEAEEVAHTITRSGGKACLVQGDLGDVTQAVQVGEGAWQQLGTLDFLVNNAGVSYKKHFLDYTPKDVDFFTNVNFKGTLFVTQTVARKMVVNRVEGAIYTVTSVNGIRPGMGLSVYGATKGALETLMQGVAMELAPHNIKVNTIALGAFETDMNAAVRQNPELLKTVNEGIPMGRFGQPEEAAHLIVDLLASGSYLTGASITLDGGLLLMRGYGKPTPYGGAQA